VRLLVFCDSGSPLAKGFQLCAETVTVSTDATAGADLVYDPQRETCQDVLRRLPPGFKPDAILITNLDYGQFLWGLGEVEVPVVAPISDSNLCFDAFHSAIPFIDLFICNEDRQARVMERYGARTAYLPWLGVDPARSTARGKEPRWDVVFVGNLNPYIHRKRGKLLEALLGAHDRFEARVLTGVDPRTCRERLSEGRIVFNHTIRGEINIRVYEALGASRLLLMEKGNLEVGRHFVDGEHYVTYEPASLIETIERYLRDGHERERIAAAGHAEARKRHTLDAKARAIAERVAELLNGWKRNGGLSAGTLRAKAAGVFLHHGRFGAALRLAEEAASAEGTPETAAQLARVLGALVYFGHASHEDAFERATDTALSLNPRSALCAWNRLELEHARGAPDVAGLRAFIARVEASELGIDFETGPLPLAYDTFRVGWQGSFSEHSEDRRALEAAQRRILLARAYDLFGEEESHAGHAHAALEAWQRSLECGGEDGYVLQKMGTAAAALGRGGEGAALLRRARDCEPFLLGARRDLAALELNMGQREEAAREAKAALDIIVTPFAQFEEPFTTILDHTACPDEVVPYSAEAPIIWQSVFFDYTGYARDASLIVDELLRRQVPLSLEAMDDPGRPGPLEPQVRRRLELALRTVPPEGRVHVFHSPPHLRDVRGGVRHRVCRTTFETDRLPAGWVDRLSQYDQVWVMSEFNRRVFLEAGLAPERIAVVPNAVGEFPMRPPESLDVVNRKRFCFLSVFEWSLRKGWDILLRAYVAEFKRTDDVALLLRVYSIKGTPQVVLRDLAREFIRSELGVDPDATPPILFLDEPLSRPEMWGLYRQAQAFVLPSRGEGFGRPYLEAVICGLPTIATRWGGQLEFLNDENAYLVDIEGLEEAGGLALYRGHRWARPSVDHLRVLMRRVYDDPEEGQRKARRSIGDLLRRYNVRRVANLVVGNLNRLGS
jgi:glycosyltransferase involved in cell wall biosynthesis